MPGANINTLYMKHGNDWVEMVSNTNSVRQLLDDAKKLLANKEVMVMDAAGKQHLPEGANAYFDLWETVDEDNLWYRTAPAMTVEEALSEERPEVFIRRDGDKYDVGDKDNFSNIASGCVSLELAKKRGDDYITEQYKNQNNDILVDAGLDPALWTFSDKSDSVTFSPIDRVGYIYTDTKNEISETPIPSWVVADDAGNPMDSYRFLGHAAKRLLEEPVPVLKDAAARRLATALTNLLTDIQSTGTPTHMFEAGISGAIDDANQLLGQLKLQTVEIPVKALVYGVFENASEKLDVEGKMPEILKPTVKKTPTPGM